MANVRELKQRMTSVQNTKKITSAMYQIASAKLRKAKAGLEKARPYFSHTESEIKKIFRTAGDTGSRYFAKKDEEDERPMGYLVITADRGLAGAYNYNVLKAAAAEIRKRKRVRLYVIGEYGRRYFKKRGGPIEEAFYYTAQDPNLHRAREIAERLLMEYDSGRICGISVIYSDMETELTSTVKCSRLLPFEHGDIAAEEGDKSRVRYHFEPSPAAVIESMIPSYMTGFVYGALVDSFSAEQNARMNAMSNANRNAEELMGSLRLEYNRTRQAIVTQEITEVAAGARAQRRKKKKRSQEEAS
ncbi:MAG: ATP synthase F1 subunit gamma [Lachnospiraceae bacterium]|nr:ATP synthase F1 subunit gamma [Lachnospiraceae bacterium]